MVELKKTSSFDRKLPCTQRWNQNYQMQLSTFQTRRSTNTVRYNRQVQSDAAKDFFFRCLETCVSCTCQAAVRCTRIFVIVRGREKGGSVVCRSVPKLQQHGQILMLHSIGRNQGSQRRRTNLGLILYGRATSCNKHLNFSLLDCGVAYLLRYFH
jgi:hypothetical protein